MVQAILDSTPSRSSSRTTRPTRARPLPRPDAALTANPTQSGPDPAARAPTIGVETILSRPFRDECESESEPPVAPLARSPRSHSSIRQPPERKRHGPAGETQPDQGSED